MAGEDRIASRGPSLNEGVRAQMADALYQQHYASALPREEYDRQTAALSDLKLANAFYGSFHERGDHRIPRPDFNRQVGLTSAPGSTQRAVVNGLTFGLADEVGAGVGALSGLVTGEGVGPAYDRILTGQRENADVFRQNNPGVGTGLEVAGAIATPMAGANALLRGGAVAAPTFLRGVGQAAVQGGAQGFGEAEGGTQNRLAAAATGGALGAGFGTALGGAGALWNRLFTRTREPYAGTAGRVADDSGAPVSAGEFTPGQTRLAAERIQNAANDPAAAAAALENPTQLVPGSMPTTAQAGNDMGLAELERAQMTANPGAFATRRGEQATARERALGGVGGNGDPGDVAAAFRQRLNDIESQGEAAIQAARADAGRADAALPGTTQNPEVAGSRLRELATAAEQRTRAEETRLWNEIDPTNSLTVELAPVRAEADRIRGALTDSATPMGAEEARIFARVTDMPAIIPLRELTDLRAAIRAEVSSLRAAAGTSTPATQRLSDLRTEIESALGTSVARSEARAGAGMAAGTLDEAARARMGAANSASRDRADRFGARSGFVNGVLARGEGPGGFTTLASAVPEGVIVSGPTGGQRLRSYLAAAGDDPATLAAVDDAAVMLARRHAMDADGALNPDRLRAWTARHQDFLRERPDLATALGDAGRAQEAVTAAMERAATATREAGQGAAARLMNLTAPEDVGRTIASMLNSPNGFTQLRALANDVAGDPAAREGVRRALANHIQERFTSTAEAGLSGARVLSRDALDKWFNRNHRALRAFFSPSEMLTLGNLVRDMARSNRSITAARNPGGSDTAQNLLAADRDLSRTGSFLNQMFNRLGGWRGGGAGTGAGIGFGLGGPVGAGIGAASGAIAGAGIDAVRALRAAGLTRVEDLITEAMLNPALARVLLTRSTTQESERRLTRAMVRALAGSSGYLAGRSQQERPAPLPRNALMGG